MAITVEMPKLSDTMSEGKILSWKKKEGEAIQAGEVLAEIESDKANMELESYETGYLRKVLVPEGGSAPVGAPIAILTEQKDESISGMPASTAAPAGAGPVDRTGEPRDRRADHRADHRPAGAAEAEATAPRAATRAEGTAASPSPAAPPPPAGARKVHASTLAFRMAAELGLDLRSIRGTGPGGRIVKRDVEEALGKGAARAGTPGRATEIPARAAPGPAAPPPRPFLEAAVPGGPAYEDVPVSSMRKVIATRLVESKNSAPHYYVTLDIDMKAVIRARAEINKLEGVDITLTDLIVKAAALCLARHPTVNASWRGEYIRLFKSVDIAVAVSIPDGLITPVLRGCQTKGLLAISSEVKDLAERARDRKLLPEEYTGGTFTISNMGMFGIKTFTAIINPPEAAILAVSAVQEVPVVEGGSIVPGLRMSLTLSCDHRVVDGASAARFLKDLKFCLENPLSLAL